MKILCVIDSLGSGGAQRQLVNLAVEFKKLDHDVSFLVYHHETFFENILKQYDIPIFEVIESNYIKRIVRMRSFIRSGNYDGVISFLEAATFICEISTLPNKSWKLIAGERSANPTITTFFKLRAYRWFHFLADAVVANSHTNIKIVKAANPLLSDKKLHVISNLIDFEKFKPKPNKYKFRKDGTFNLIVVSSHQFLKNLDGLIEAVNLLSDEDKSILKINWYGGTSIDSSKEDGLRKIELYNLQKIIELHDPTNLINEKINEADALGLFSYYEGLPNVVCEAMANAKPVISSNVSDIHILINKQFIFNPYDPKDISDKISILLGLRPDSLKDIGLNNRAKAIELFNRQNIVQQYLKLLQ